MTPTGESTSGGRPRGTKSERWKIWFFWLGPLVSTPILYWFLNLLNSRFLDIGLLADGWRFDLLLHVCVAYVILAFSRKFSLFLLNQSLAMGILFL